MKGVEKAGFHDVETKSHADTVPWTSSKGQEGVRANRANVFFAESVFEILKRKRKRLLNFYSSSMCCAWKIL